MQVFELHFNPKQKKDIVFDNFYYEPADIYEARLGHLFLAGELLNVLPQNERFLKNLARVIKTKFYSLKTKSPENSFSETLKETNNFLEKISREGDVSWISNLNFSILSISPRFRPEIKKYLLNFTKVGNIKIFLARGNKVLDIGKQLDSEDIEPYPLKIFSNVVSGRLEYGDRILIMTKNAAEMFENQKITAQIANLESFDERTLNKALKDVRKDISGICLLFALEQTERTKGAQKLILREQSFKKKIVQTRKFVKTTSVPFIKAAKTLKNLTIKLVRKTLELIKRIKIPSFSKFSEISSKIPKIKLPASPFPRPFPPPTALSSTPSSAKAAKATEDKKAKKKKKIKKRLPKKPLFTFIQLSQLQKDLFEKILAIKNAVFTVFNKKNFILITSLILLILIAGFFSKIEQNLRTNQIKPQLEEIQEKINQAQAFLILEKNEQANSLLLQALSEIEPLKIESPLKNKVLEIEQEINQKLSELNNLEIIKEPELIFSFNIQEHKFIPQKIISFGNKFYFFNIYSENIFEINESGEYRILETEQKFENYCLKDDDTILFLLEDKLFPFENGVFKKTFSLEKLYQDFNFSNISCFNSNLYLLDKNKGTISKYEYFGGLAWNVPKTWIENEPEIKQAKSMAIDGGIWFLNKEGKILRFYAGEFEKQIEIKTFPVFKNPVKIWTSPFSSYLFVLEPEQKRIIITDKNGSIVKQYQSEKFDNLKDFSVSLDEKTIYLLNNLSVYKIDL